MSCKHPKASQLALGHLVFTYQALIWCDWCGAIKHGYDGKWTKPATAKPTKRSKATR